VDFIESENSSGFHAPQEAARILVKSVDYSRRGQSALAAYTSADAHPDRR
jgi:nitrite reductase (cytochrome c-552)